MTLEIRPFRASDFAAIARRQGDDYDAAGLLDEDSARFIEREGLALTGLVDGQVIGCGGLYERWPGRWESFAFLNEVSGRHSWGVVTRAARELIERARAKGAHRIEAHVDSSFLKARKWARKALDMNNETPAGMKRFAPDGRSFCLYARTW